MRIERMAVVAVATVAAIVACSDSNGPGGGLSGNYVLDSLIVDTGPTLVPPIATGTLDFSAPSNIVATIVLQPPAVPKVDSTITLPGTYTLKGSDSIYLSVYGGLVTIPGTEVQSGNKLVLDVQIPPGLIVAGVTPTRVILAWHK
jgi:hypothetical protein